MLRIIVTALISCMVWCSIVLAQSAAKAPSDTLAALPEQVSISVVFNRKAPSLPEARQLIADLMSAVEKLAAEQKLDKFEVQNYNYNVSAQPDYSAYGASNPPSYNVNGSITYSLTNADAAFGFADILSKKGYQVNVSANGYRGAGRC